MENGKYKNKNYFKTFLLMLNYLSDTKIIKRKMISWPADPFNPSDLVVECERSSLIKREQFSDDSRAAFGRSDVCAGRALHVG